MSTSETIIDLLNRGSFDINEIRSISQALNKAHNRTSLAARGEFRVGDDVIFTRQNGVVLTGKVVRINRKSITVDTDNGEKWRVGPSLLSKVEAKDAA